MEKIPGDYIAGFVDGEGCFALKFRREVKHGRGKRSGIKPIYFYWDIEFAIMLREDDKGILEKIKDTLGCGNLTKPNKRGMVRYAVNRISDLSDKIVPFFEKYQLRAKKKFDFELWKEAVKIFKRNQRLIVNRKPGERGFYKTNWNPKDLNRLKIIHNEMKRYKSGGREWKWLKSF
jgi:hypothetical protein